LTTMNNIIDLVMRETEAKWKETERARIFYEKLALQNMVYTITSGKAERMSEEGRHRLSKQLATTFVKQYGAFAHLKILEHFEREPQYERMWRDALTWIDELTKGEKKCTDSTTND
jgi:hypothetical protein